MVSLQYRQLGRLVNYSVDDAGRTNKIWRETQTWKLHALECVVEPIGVNGKLTLPYSQGDFFSTSIQ